jgi:hypothetical protein
MKVLTFDQAKRKAKQEPDKSKQLLFDIRPVIEAAIVHELETSKDARIRREHNKKVIHKLNLSNKKHA